MLPPQKLVSTQMPHTTMEPVVFLGYANQTCLVPEEHTMVFVFGIRSHLNRVRVHMRILGYHSDNNDHQKVVDVWVPEEALEALNKGLRLLGYNPSS